MNDTFTNTRVVLVGHILAAGFSIAGHSNLSPNQNILTRVAHGIFLKKTQRKRI
jgi:hypothetical protein